MELAVDVYHEFFLQEVIPKFVAVGQFRVWLGDYDTGPDSSIHIFETDQGTFALWREDYALSLNPKILESGGIVIENFVLVKPEFESYFDGTVHKCTSLKGPNKWVGEVDDRYVRYLDDDYALMKVACREIVPKQLLH